MYTCTLIHTKDRELKIKAKDDFESEDRQKTVLNPIHKKLHIKKTEICAEIVLVKVGKLVSKDCILWQKNIIKVVSCHILFQHTFSHRDAFINSFALLHQLIIDNEADAEIGCGNAPERIALHVFLWRFSKKI